MNPRRLYRSRDRQLAGVAGGMAEYLDLDPTIVRILWIIAGLASAGFALLAYIVLALVIPQAPWAVSAGGPGTWAPTGAGPGAGTAAGWSAPPAAPGAPAWEPQWSTAASAAPAPRPRAETRGLGIAAIVGVVLIVFGAVALADAAIPGWIAGAILGPAVVLALGAALLVSSIRRREDEPAPAPAAPAPAAPAPAAPVAPADAWDATDTQAVDAASFGTADQPGDPGARPA